MKVCWFSNFIHIFSDVVPFKHLTEDKKDRPPVSGHRSQWYQCGCNFKKESGQEVNTVASK